MSIWQFWAYKNIISIVYKYIIYLRDRKAYFTVPGISVNRGHVAVIFLVFLIGKSYW